MRKAAFRQKVVNNHNHIDRGTSFLSDIPYEIRDGAMVDLYEAFDTNWKKKKLNPSHTFEVKFRPSKAPQQSILIRKIAYKKGVLYPTYTDKLEQFFREAVPEKLQHDARLVKTRDNEFYLCIQEDIQKPCVEKQDTSSVIALDPGVRVFQTGYDYKGKVIEYAPGDVSRIYRLCAHLDALQSRIASQTTSKKTRYNMRKAFRRATKKIHNLVDDVHHCTAAHLCKNYSMVLLPTFETQKMSARQSRKINSKTARAMMTWSHYRFKQFLLHKARETGTKVAIVSEAYTSKTCGACGFIHQKLGGNKSFKCPSCSMQCGRDVQGSRNILLRNFDLLELQFVGN
jgi:putative transposase